MKERFEPYRLILRGIGVLHRLSPWNLLAKCVRSVSNAAQPFANLYLSAAIVNALTAGSGWKALLKLVALTLLVNLFLVLLSKAMDAVNYRKWNEFYLRYNLSIGEKAQSLPYSRIEDPATHLMIKNVDDAMKIGNYGLIKLHSRIPLFVENLCKVLFSLSMILSAVLQKSAVGQTALQRFANSLGADGILLLLITGAAWACIRANRRNAALAYESLGRVSRRNRIFDFYLDHYLDGHRAGKDVRLYRQDGLIARELAQTAVRNSETVEGMHRGGVPQ